VRWRSLASTLPLLVATVGVLFFLAETFLLYRHFGYQSAFGGDVYNHATYIRYLQELGWKALYTEYANYPRVYHGLVWGMMELRGTSNPLLAMLYLQPVLILGAALATGAAVWKLAGRWAGTVALLFVLFGASQPLQTLYDGGGPSYLAVTVGVPLFALCGVMFLERRQVRWLTGLVLVGLFTVMTHHVTTAYILILLLTTLLVTPQLRKWLAVALALVVAILLSPLGQGVRDLVKSILFVQPDFPWLRLIGQLDGPDALLPLAAYPDMMGRFVFWAGIATTVWVLVRFLQRRAVEPLALVLAGLAVILLVASQATALRFPVRLARDLAVPFTILAWYGSAQLLMTIRRYPLARLGQTAVVAALLLMLSPQLVRQYERRYTYEPTLQYSGAVAEAMLITNSSKVFTENMVVAAAAYPERVGWGVFRPVSNNPEEMFFSERNTSLVADYEYVVYPLSESHEVNLGYQLFLESQGFTQLTLLHDPNRTLALYGRQ
jgi:hypothetical protein